MSLKIDQSGKENAVLALTGRLDTATAPELEKVLDGVLPECRSLVLDMAQLEYVSSAGLRLLLKAQKAMKDRGEMKLVHVSEDVMEVLDITGFSDILTIE